MMESGRTADSSSLDSSLHKRLQMKSNKKRTGEFKRSGTTDTFDTFDMDASTHSRGGSLRYLSKIEDLVDELPVQTSTKDEKMSCRNNSLQNKSSNPRTVSRTMSCPDIDRKSQTTAFKRPSLVPMSSSRSILKRRESCPDFKRGAKTVSFGAVEFRLHQRTAGDNPSVSDRGPAFDLEWEYVDGPCESVDDYESHRTTENPRKANKSSLRINGRDRENILKYDNGVSTRAIQTSIMSISKAKADRKKTMKKGKKYEKINEIGENLSRKVKKLFGKSPRTSRKKVLSLSQ
ncbi:hypothetical protein CTEN210_03669 [Chaetoceros tenuissimus]|uniref:Uncharacterized protein n=1 Tax=Chaetoceros tenuissimus TaxID=426638 RepID=A0AAD3H276_9STRA|nr:hypothetical protein CTEN210_03669 [Chaetoceros tenuissimus]